LQENKNRGAAIRSAQMDLRLTEFMVFLF
jgi:hypothetical protein